MLGVLILKNAELSLLEKCEYMKLAAKPSKRFFSFTAKILLPVPLIFLSVYVVLVKQAKKNTRLHIKKRMVAA